MEFSQAQAVASRLEVLDESASTNAALRVLSADAAAWPHLSAVVTDNQTAGRGRLDRTWEAPAGSAIAVSALLRSLPSDPTAMGWIPLVAGLAMADAVTVQLPGHDVAVKWPNDVLVDGRKISGILAEATGSAVVIGVGVNTAMTPAQLPVPTATSFAAVGAVADEDRLVADFLRRLDGLLSALVTWGDADRSGVHAAVSARCATLGRDVEVSLPDGSTLHGVARRLEPDGRLCVADGDAEHVIAAGDVVHARLA
ncbi:BirA family biotin operon repressor/biotin-[acetyl-CoA-carboxylase] ligase [Microbacterium ginsengiterrae]|uniref:biotin--[biotin carboxyl-carrier protein] ligase n=1 Tax=Microbacterium ginsengiterrae TaxID=546115 RepID=A0A7W9CE08_9MICO|nr:biotin--[acetyl-CoA-carboxylase] ligase [Microbacterium ginsengiterrae]MBB5743716.1 BirA family biotin operon repressor/biotin-[acetyl-CoA-carboxylase] ligase [Microbacterium ginsengiterrae]